MRVRFHLDEHVPSGVAEGLRRRGIDVTTTIEAALMGADDASQLASASSSGRVLVTHDADFLRLHAQGTVHWGIAFSPQGKSGIGGMLRRLILIHDLLDAEEMRGRVEFL